MKKTYSREIAVLLLVYLCGMGAGAYGNVEALQILTFPFIGFVALAFGFKAGQNFKDVMK